MVNTGDAKMSLKPTSFSSQSLQASLRRIASELLPILKTLGNSHRVSILIELLGGSLAFQTLLARIPLQKTALSNHLQQLQNTKLIEKPEYGLYCISRDGLIFLRTLHETYQNSLLAQEKKANRIQQRPMSPEFFGQFLGNSAD